MRDHPLVVLLLSINDTVLTAASTVEVRPWCACVVVADPPPSSLDMLTTHFAFLSAAFRLHHTFSLEVCCCLCIHTDHHTGRQLLRFLPLLDHLIFSEGLVLRVIDTFILCSFLPDTAQWRTANQLYIARPRFTAFLKTLGDADAEFLREGYFRLFIIFIAFCRILCTSTPS